MSDNPLRTALRAVFRAGAEAMRESIAASIDCGDDCRCRPHVLKLFGEGYLEDARMRCWATVSEDVCRGWEAARIRRMPLPEMEAPGDE